MQTPNAATTVRRHSDGWVPLVIVIVVLGLVHDWHSLPADSGRPGVAVFTRRMSTVDQDDFRSTDLVAVFGSNRLDIRRAGFSGGVPTVGAVAVFGRIELVVPPGTRVVGDRIPLLGSVQVRTGSAEEHGPEIRVNAVALFGSVIVHN